MKYEDLLYNLKAALKEDNQDYFVELCYTKKLENGSDGVNFHCLYVLKSTITEDNDTFVNNLYKCVADDDEKNYILIQQLDTLNDEGKFNKYLPEANYLAFELYTTYEDELDNILIWDNAEKIIKDLEDYLLAKED